MKHPAAGQELNFDTRAMNHHDRLPTTRDHRGVHGIHPTGGPIHSLVVEAAILDDVIVSDVLLIFTPGQIGGLAVMIVANEEVQAKQK